MAEDVYRRIIEGRHARRNEASPEERQLEALEQIADTLTGIELALERIADKD